MTDIGGQRCHRASIPTERRLIAILDIAFASPLEGSFFYASDAFIQAADGLKADVAYASPFAVSGVYTYVREKQLTLAGLRGSRPAQLIERLGARNQIAADVRHLLHTGTLLERR